MGHPKTKKPGKPAVCAGCSELIGSSRYVGVDRLCACAGCGRTYHALCTGINLDRCDSPDFRCAVCESAARPVPAVAVADEVAAHCQAVLRDGFCVLRGVIPVASLERCRAEVADFFAAALAAYLDTRGPVKRRRDRRGPEFSNFKQRLANRYDLTPPRFEFERPAVDVDAWSADWCPGEEAPRAVAWMPVVRGVLGADCAAMARGVMLARAGAAAQDWHTDGPVLCEDTQLPPHALNVFVPLVAVDEDNGTAVIPGSHMPTEPQPQPVVPRLDVGDVLIFDYRLVHRGEKNQAPTDRPVVFLSYSVPWFFDVPNFSSYQYGTRLAVGNEPATSPV